MMNEETEFFVLHSSFIVFPHRAMKLPQPFNIAKPRRRRTRRAQVSSAAPPQGVTVVSVSKVDDQTALWLFSAAIVSFGDVSGLIIGGQEGDTVEQSGADALQVFYDIGVSVDDPWSIEGFPAVVIAFAGGGVLVVPESGNVV